MLKQANPAAYVWASGYFYDVAAPRTEAGEIGFVVCPTVCPTVEMDIEPPEICRPYDATELLELAAAGAEVVAAEEECPSGEVGNRRRLSYHRRMNARQPSFRYSISCEEIYEIAHERTAAFLAAHPEATPEEVEEAITVIADDVTPPASSSRQLLELAMQGEEVMRRPLPEFFFAGCSCGCPRPTLGDLLRESYLIELKIDLLYAAGVLDDLLDDDDEETPESPGSESRDLRAATATPAERQAEDLLRSIELDPTLRQS